MVRGAQASPPAEINALAEYLIKRGVDADTVTRVRKWREEHPLGREVSDELAYALSRPPASLTQESLATMMGVTRQAISLAIKRHRAVLEATQYGDWRAELPREWGSIRREDRDDDFDRAVRAVVMSRLHSAGRGPAPDETALDHAQRFAEALAETCRPGAVIFYRLPQGWLLRNRRPDDDPDCIYVPE